MTELKDLLDKYNNKLFDIIDTYKQFFNHENESKSFEPFGDKFRNLELISNQIVKFLTGHDKNNLIEWSDRADTLTIYINHSILNNLTKLQPDWTYEYRNTRTCIIEKNEDGTHYNFSNEILVIIVDVG